MLRRTATGVKNMPLDYGTTFRAATSKD